MSGMAGMEGMDGMAEVPTAPALADADPSGTGLADSVLGYSFRPSAAVLPTGTPGTYAFHISGPDGRTVTRYQPYEGALMVFYLVRSDLTGFRQFDPAMQQDGTWSVTLPSLPPGSYRTYITFAAPESGSGTPLTYALSQTLTVPGQASDTPLPGPASSADTDGLSVTLSGRPKAGVSVPLTVGVAKDGKPITYFQRYLDGYAHLTAFHVGDLAVTHLLSTGRSGDHDNAAALSTEALFPESGTWRVFVQFRTDDTLHTAAFTVNVS